MNNSNNLRDKGYRTIIISSCPVDDCSQCVGSYINEILECQLLCKCHCHSKLNDPSCTKGGECVFGPKEKNNARGAEVDTEEVGPYLAKSSEQKGR